MQRKINALWGEKKVVLCQTPRAVTPFGGLSVWVEFLGKIGYREQVREHMPVQWRSPNAIAAEETFTAFLIAVLVGVKRGYNPRKHGRASHPPLLAVLGEPNFILHGWLRSGNTRSDSGVVEFLKEALAKLASGDWIRVVRADSGFFAQELLQYLESRELPYIVVAQLRKWLKREAARVQKWRALDETYAVGEFRLKLLGWDRERRFVMLREQLRETKRSLGRKLFEVPGYTFRVFVTNRLDPPEEIWRDYNQRACIDQRIEELKSDLAADDFCLHEFFATEAAFLGILMLFNLLGEFQRASGMTGYRQPASLRVQVFICGAILGHAARRTVLHLSAAWGGLAQRNSLFDKILQYEIPTSPKLNSQPLTTG